MDAVGPGGHEAIRQRAPRDAAPRDAEPAIRRPGDEAHARRAVDRQVLVGDVGRVQRLVEDRVLVDVVADDDLGARLEDGERRRLKRLGAAERHARRVVDLGRRLRPGSRGVCVARHGLHRRRRAHGIRVVHPNRRRPVSLALHDAGRGEADVVVHDEVADGHAQRVHDENAGARVGEDELGPLAVDDEVLDVGDMQVEVLDDFVHAVHARRDDEPGGLPLPRGGERLPEGLRRRNAPRQELGHRDGDVGARDGQG